MQSGGRERSARSGFEAVLEQSIKEGLRNILGESGLQMVLSLCPLKTITSDPIRFRQVLTDIFMENGAMVIEREVARMLLKNAGVEAKPLEMSRRWLASATSSKGRSGTTMNEADPLRGFLELESLPKGHIGHADLRENPIEVTAANFAYAFKRETR